MEHNRVMHLICARTQMHVIRSEKSLLLSSSSVGYIRS